MVVNKHAFNLLFAVIVFSLSIIFYHNTISEFPRAVHAWTQSDRYAIALKFIENGFDFFHPATYNLKGREGITQVDFPIHEYLVAIIMKMAGTTEPVVFRLYVLLYSIIGLYFLFRLTNKITGNYFYSMLAVVFVFTMPVYCYNQAGFIPSVPSFSTALTGIYFLYEYSVNKRIRSFIWAVVFMTLAALTRLPFSAFLFALLVVVLIKKEKFTREIFPVFIGIAVVGGYYLYNRYLAKEYGTIFWMDPLYVSSWEMLKEIFRAIRDRWITEYFTFFHYLIYITAIVVGIIKRKRVLIFFKEHSLFSLWLIISFAGMLAYFFVNGRQYIDHDYYFIDSFQLPLLVLFLLLLRFIDFRKRPVNIIFISSFSVLLVLSSYSCYASQKKRFAILDYDECEQARQCFIGSDKYLDSIGVSRDSKLFVIQAYTYNTPFIYMKRNGYTALICRNGDLKPEMLNKDFEYVIMPNRFIAKEVLPYAPYIMERLVPYSTNEEITVYKLNKEKYPTGVEKFLNIKNENVLRSSKIFFTDNRASDGWTGINTTDSIYFFSLPVSYINKPEQEYGLTYSFPVEKIPGGDLDKMVFIKAKIRMPYSKNLVIVLSVDKDEKNIFYDNYSLNKEHINMSEEWQDIIYAFTLSSNLTEGNAKLYLWNPDKNTFWLDDVEIIIYTN